EAADLAIFSEAVPIYPKHVHETFANPVRFGIEKAIGTGQYKMVNMQPGVGVLLEKNPDYKLYSPSNPPSNVKRFQFVNMPDTGTQMASLLAGQIEMSRDLTPEDGANIAKSSPDLQSTVAQGLGIVYLAFDSKGRTGVKALQDVRVRKALAMSIDRDAIHKLLFGDVTGLERPPAMCFPVQAGCRFTVPLPKYDPAAAKKLLAEAGYGKGLKLEITTFSIPITRAVTQAVAGFFGAVGVAATIDATPITAYRKKQSDGRIQVMIGPWPGGGVPDVNQTLSFIFSTPPSRDYHGDDAMRNNARAVQSTLDEAKRDALAQQVFDRATNQVYMIPLAGFPSSIVHRKEVTIGKMGLYTNYGLLAGDINWAK
ncbi:MAG: ABC transporter substrate-binding protein, partial [Beijerinckiaceae bacterium]